MVNVISFSLYGTSAKYILGMKENIILGKKHFSGWEIRVYYNDTVPPQYINEYKEMGAVCIKMSNYGDKMNWEGMWWRFLPLDDDTVDFWLSRDADSRVSEREFKLVDEWMKSGKTLHCIRDHRKHTYPIMGGMFGINNKKFHDTYKFDKIKDMIKSLVDTWKDNKYNVDQKVLNETLWEILKLDSMSHISNGGRRIYESDIEIPRVDYFVGCVYNVEFTNP